MIALLVSMPAWAQRHPNGEPSPAVQLQEKQADYARKQHPHSGKPKEQKASLRTKDSPATKSRRARPGEAALRTPSK